MGKPIEVHYQYGLYLPELDLWLDPRGHQARAFVSHAHSDHFARHDRVISSVVTRDLIQSRFGKESAREFIALEWGQLLEWNGFSLKLLPAGHIFGSAMILITRLSDQESLLYTGDFKLRESLTVEKPELCHADTFIMETTFGLPHYRFPTREETEKKIRHFVLETLEEKGIPVLVGYSLGKAQELHACLKGLKVPIMLHPSILKVIQIYEKWQGNFPEWRSFEVSQAEGHVLIMPPSAARSSALRKLKNVRYGVASGWCLDSSAQFRYQADEVFVLSDHADYPQLMDAVQRVQPSRVYTLHGFASEFAQDLRARGIEAWSIIGENQLTFHLNELPVSGEENLSDEREEAELIKESPPETFLAWASMSQEIAGISSRLEKQRKLAAYLIQLDEEELKVAVRWFAGNLNDPGAQSKALHVGRAVIRQALMNYSGLSEREYKSISQSQNDSGRSAFLILNRSERRGVSADSPVRMGEVDLAFETLRQTTGNAEKAQLLVGLFSKMSALEGSYLVRLLTGELRIGAREGFVEESVALAFESEVTQIREAAMFCGDLGKVALHAKVKRLSEIEPQLFTPLKVMLASPEPTAEAIWNRLKSEETHDLRGLWLEEKFDGIRAQIHRGRNRTEIYTRELNAVSQQFPELIESHAHADEWIVDGEIIASDKHGNLDFFDLQKRLGRKDQGDLFIESEIKIRYVVFDLLWLNGKSLLDLPLSERRTLLDRLELPPQWERIAQFWVKSVDEIEAAFHAARRHGNEGLIAKDPQSVYSPGRRGKSWLKLKKAFSTLDVVVVKAEQGHGKRSQYLSDYTFAVQDSEGQLKTIGKAYSGLKDEEIEELTLHFEETTLSRKGNVREVEPRIVLEIAFDSIRPSRRHESGLALRFPRIKGIRKDKSVHEIDTLDYAQSLAGIHGGRSV